MCVEEVADHLQADVTGLLRVELHATDELALDGCRERAAVRGRGDAVGGHRGGVGVREVDLRAVGDAVEQAGRARLRQRVPADVGTFTVGGSRSQRPFIRPRPGTSSASLLDSNSHCRPRQMPNSGTPAATARDDGLAPRPSSGAVD